MKAKCCIAPRGYFFPLDYLEKEYWLVANAFLFIRISVHIEIFIQYFNFLASQLINAAAPALCAWFSVHQFNMSFQFVFRIALYPPNVEFFPTLFPFSADVRRGRNICIGKALGRGGEFHGERILAIRLSPLPSSVVGRMQMFMHDSGGRNVRRISSRYTHS